ncbi:MAG: hypothetical protein KGJ86_03180 [Chloroflexota bacterium]|nr:hypothetical protein [Chloroflexota bacterium]
MRISRKVAIGSGAAGLALAAAIYGGTALAQSGSPSPSAGASSSAASGYQSFLQHLASRLNLSQAQVDSAVKGAETDVVADAVKSGRLTQAQADKIDQRIQSGQGFGFGFGFGHRPGPGGRPNLGIQPQAVLNAAAGALNLQPSELRSQLRSGKSLKDIAAAQNVDFSKVQAAITSAVKPQLDQDVSSGKLTQQQEQNILDRLTSGDFPGRHRGR